MNYSSFGKELRKIMIDNDSRLYDLAKALGVSSSFVSSVICGNKSVPEDWIPTIVKKYNIQQSMSRRGNFVGIMLHKNLILAI